jgi:hypothetical protein
LNVVTTVYFIDVFTVIKSIAYFPAQCALNSKPVMSAFLDCCQAAGVQTQENSMTADAVVIWSVLWHGRMRPNQAVYEHYRSQNKPVIVIDIGALYRGTTWKLAVNHITRDGYYGHESDLDRDRPRKLQISLANQVSPGPEIIIAAQHKNSLQVAGIGSMESWVLMQIQQLRNSTDRPIRIRAHPRSPLRMPCLPDNTMMEVARPVANTYDSFDMHFNCHAVVNHNSGPGIQAGIAGCRPIVAHSSLAYPVSVGYTDIEQPYTVDRETWLAQICHTEYTVEELRQGLWLKRIEPALLTV